MDDIAALFGVDEANFKLIITYRFERFVSPNDVYFILSVICLSECYLILFRFGMILTKSDELLNLFVMITQFQVIGLLKEELILAGENGNFSETPRAFSSIHASIHSLSDFTRENIEQRHFQTVRKCFALAEQIYLEGDIMVQLLIERVFIGSLILIRRRKTQIDCLITPVLQKIYLRQLDSQIPPSHISGS